MTFSKIGNKSTQKFLDSYFYIEVQKILRAIFLGGSRSIDCGFRFFRFLPSHGLKLLLPITANKTVFWIENAI